MEAKDIKEIQERIKTLSVFELVDEDIRKELTNLYILLGDIFSIAKAKYDNNYLKKEKIDKLREDRRYIASKRKEIKKSFFKEKEQK